MQPAVYATRGRGLRIVRSLAHEWGVLDEDRGRTVWVCLGGPVPPPPSLTSLESSAMGKSSRRTSSTRPTRR